MYKKKSGEGGVLRSYRETVMTYLLLTTGEETGRPLTFTGSWYGPSQDLSEAPGYVVQGLLGRRRRSPTERDRRPWYRRRNLLDPRSQDRPPARDTTSNRSNGPMVTLTTKWPLCRPNKYFINQMTTSPTKWLYHWPNDHTTNQMTISPTKWVYHQPNGHITK